MFFQIRITEFKEQWSDTRIILSYKSKEFKRYLQNTSAILSFPENIPLRMLGSL